MPGRKVFGLVCLVFSTACLVVGYARLGLWTAMGVALPAFLIGLFAWKCPSPWLPAAALCVSICLAAAGVLFGALPLLMIVCSTLGLASWDLALQDRELFNSTTLNIATLFEKKHYTSLALALGSGLLVAVTARLVRLQIPFVAMLLLVLLLLLSLHQVWNLLIRKNV
jgi:hypothetical protein